ncbi:PDZ domain-containing protein [Acanthopleuribacter pedis]|uniref:PDZ domain-containing protein n=1 Tax=Acanthopleuribacter pedis TaxID=442870 RepID=A0A8J7U0F1_9BACT|nr:PDZ domain-containing protein [Acanthopleuribacter pedis]MBO1316998.1 PDZ domain-containing protein [Acanthopleuribacter pedis]
MKRQTLKTWLTVLLVSLMLTVSSLSAGEKSKEKDKGYLGVNIETIKSDGETKVKILKVLPDSAAAKAGLEAEDLIISVNGEVIDTSSGLVEEIIQHHAGDEVLLKVLRDGESKELAAILGEKGDLAESVARRFAFFVPDEDQAFLGINMDQLGPQMARYFKVDQGVLIESVVEGSPAEAAGLEAGDIVQSLDGELVAKPKDLRAAMRKYQPGDEMTVEVIRREKPMSFEVVLGQAEKKIKHFNYHFNNGNSFVIDGDAPHVRIETLQDAENMLHENLELLEAQLQELKSRKSEAAPKPKKEKK